MSTATAKQENAEPLRTVAVKPRPQREKPRWETPRMEEVSEQVMAQPYIRFT
ncbi:MAG TPA: hypothetical protein VMT66_00820 [Steroidobacteraceae bacterium]|nr:hypothetical protein [Steroidobacteraceae bacterium]